MFLNPLKHIAYFSQMEIPTVYSDALSYLEDVSRLYQKVNEIISSYNVLIDYYNSLDDTLKELQNKIAEWQKEIDALQVWQKELEAEFAAEIAKLNGQFEDLDAELTEKLDTAIAQMNANIQNILNQQMAVINAQLKAFEKQIADNNMEMKTWVQAKLDEFEHLIPTFQDVMIVNPKNNKLEPLQQVIDDIYMNTLWDALTCEEYDALGLTAAQYDDWYDVGFSTGKGVTAERYDQHGRSVFFLPIREKRSNPVTGTMEKPIRIIRTNTDLLRAPGAITAKEYDAMGITAAEYDALKVSAYQYDWSGNRLVKKGE